VAVISKKAESIIIGLAAIFLFFAPGLRISYLDNASDAYFREAIAKAGIAYAQCRLVNASISIVKDSDFDLEPMGIGVSLAVGQVLDPIDDMTERVSDVLVTAITALGVEKLAYEICVAVVPQIAALLLLILSLIVWFKNERFANVQKALARFLVLMLFARLALPVSALANTYLHEHFFAQNIADANKALAAGSAELDKLKEISFPEVDGTLGTIKNSAAFIQRKSVELKDALIATVSNSGNIIENLLRLTLLYVGVFLIQVIALPIMTFWLLVKLANSLMVTKSPAVFLHP